MSLATASSTLQQRLDELRAKHDVPGASLAVLEAGDVTSVASGVLNLDTGVEATVDSLFQIGSITKVWTTTVVMRLVDEGLIELDAPLRTYIPEFRVADEAASAAVTIRHLLTHSSGIDGDNFSDTGRGDDALERYVATCANLRLVHPVGATMSYCNTGFTLLGRVIEVVTGQVWDAVMQERLFAPLALTHTATLPEDVLRFRAAMGHINPTGEEQVTAPAWGLPRTAGPPGGICSTAAEVVRFAQLHLTDESLRAMQEQQVVVPSGGDGISSRYWGLGWSIFEWGGRPVLGHDGNTIGQAAFLRIVPDSGVAVALLTNGGDSLGFYRDLYAELLDVEMPAALVPPAEPLPVDASLYAGIYEREGASFRVEGKDGGLVATMTVTGLGSEMTPEPFELPLRLVREDDDLFVTQHPAAPGTWLPGRFVTLEDGSRIMHFGGRATPQVNQVA
jgi:CubicO group peptidase (beta-lactamase class C family)